jgi:hypothetical protein
MYAKKELSQTAKDLLTMADCIERDGWCQRSLYNMGNVCILGAGYKTKIFNTSDEARINGAYRALFTHLGMEPAKWNDAPERTVEQVLTMLKELAYNLDYVESQK